jgi:hypothetical protein
MPTNIITMLMMVALTALNLIVFGLNLSTRSSAAVGGKNENALVADQDFDRAVLRVVEKYCIADGGVIYCKYE